MLRALRAFAAAPLIPPKPPYPIVQLETFRCYSSPSSQTDDKGEHTEKSGSERDTSNPQTKNEQSSPQSMSTDQIAHSEGAFKGNKPNPAEASKEIEKEHGQGAMQTTAANPAASKPPPEAQD
ncbi:hypothetical protein FRC03_012743 [Tulasnella sp. 419]|nr:hypothetical protein FRC03_012743 [Tulasnella sp. 419]